jgi:hypothetical protein
MSETMRMWVEVSFNVAYLVMIWALVFSMRRRQVQLMPSERPLAQLFIWAFGLLALGDTGHVGFRVLAYSLGDLEKSFTLLGVNFGLVGLGALSTAVTVTLFYVVMLMIWQKRFNKPYGLFGALLFLAAVVRLAIMLFPQNQWNNTVPPQPWSFYRNLPLVIVGLGVAYLILRDAYATGGRTFTWIGAMILISYAFYAPVILFVQVAPAVGMLMIPKTLAYIGMAILAYRDVFRVPAPQSIVT